MIDQTSEKSITIGVSGLTDPYIAYREIANQVRGDETTQQLMLKYAQDPLGKTWLTLLSEYNKLEELTVLPDETRETLLTAAAALEGIWSNEPVYDSRLYAKRQTPILAKDFLELAHKMWLRCSPWAAIVILDRKNPEVLVGKALKEVDEYRRRIIGEKYFPQFTEKHLEAHEFGILLAGRVWSRFAPQSK